MTAVALRGVARTYADGTRALRPTDLDLPPGRTAVLLGPSGCGKTTLLRLIAGLAAPDPGGRIAFDGRDVTALPAERRNVGVVFQSYALFPHLTVAGNVAYGLAARRVPRAERDRRVAEMLALVRMEGFADRRPDQLSGGQRQRVALARALAPAPALLLLDEPLTALDARLRESLRDELAALLERLRITALFVTHDQAEALALGHLVVVMEAGRVAQAAPPREVYGRPADRFVAGFVGTLNDLGGGRFCRPEALRIDPAGTLSGTVVAAHYQGARTRIVVAGPAGALTLEAAEAPPVGATVNLAADPAMVFPLPR